MAPRMCMGGLGLCAPWPFGQQQQQLGDQTGEGLQHAKPPGLADWLGKAHGLASRVW